MKILGVKDFSKPCKTVSKADIEREKQASLSQNNQSLSSNQKSERYLRHQIKIDHQGAN